MKTSDILSVSSSVYLSDIDNICDIVNSRIGHFPKTGCVYFALDPLANEIKMGRAGKPDRRIKQHHTSNRRLETVLVLPAQLCGFFNEKQMESVLKDYFASEQCIDSGPVFKNGEGCEFFKGEKINSFIDIVHTLVGNGRFDLVQSYFAKIGIYPGRYHVELPTIIDGKLQPTPLIFTRYNLGPTHTNRCKKCGEVKLFGEFIYYKCKRDDVHNVGQKNICHECEQMEPFDFPYSSKLKYNSKLKRKVPFLSMRFERMYDDTGAPMKFPDRKNLYGDVYRHVYSDDLEFRRMGNGEIRMQPYSDRAHKGLSPIRILQPCSDTVRESSRILRGASLLNYCKG
jgi:hypothetical protein